ncbi:hypothetical protein F5Y00DRAFT_210319 [Daldinia vernicosa]|uniref:uncharacterized protein n=1 Tax=Daldinia vernicosa TaxID=114800 RepID=UPI0020089FEA|nr:uncharacterized protein F5Y00DRAFT_210319 [Daldinia vernicosa]KAI0844169.1 hypothetical protein F5Y00DRAFT_210319 [Daldinia vernicosa]
MTKSCLPAFPLVVFGVVEPVLLIWAYIVALRDPTAFFAAQAPNFPLPLPVVSVSEPEPVEPVIPPQALVLLLQLVNVYLLLAGLAVVCSWTPHASVARGYLVVVALADYGHIWACYRGVGAELFWNTAEWNDMLWGGVGVSLALNVVRWFTVLGAFGALGGPRGPGGKKKKNV